MYIQALQAFVAVVDQGSFSRAAQTLHLTQPAITKRVQVLEARVGTTLFDRFQRRIILTEAGRLLLPNARQILQQMNHAELAIRNLSGSVAGPLTLATSHHIGLHRLPALIKEFSRRYPDVELDLQFMESDKAYEAVASGRVELAVAPLHPDPPQAIVGEPIRQDPWAFVVAPGHPLTMPGHADLAALSAYNAILPEPTTHTYRIVQQLFAQQQVPLKAVMPTNYLETIKMMVSVGLGWSVLPVSMLDSSLVVLPQELGHLERRLGAILHRDRILSNAARAIVELASQPAHTPPPSSARPC